MFTESKLVEVNANEFWDENGGVDLNFLRTNNRACKADDSMFLMDGLNFTEQLQCAVDFGCSEAFLLAYRHAVVDLPDLVLFYHDV